MLSYIEPYCLTTVFHVDHLCTLCCYWVCSSLSFFLFFFSLFHFPTEIYVHFSRAEISMINLKLLTQCAQWSQFIFQHFLESWPMVSQKICALQNFSPTLMSVRDVMPPCSNCCSGNWEVCICQIGGDTNTLQWGRCLLLPSCPSHCIVLDK